MEVMRDMVCGDVCRDAEQSSRDLSVVAILQYLTMLNVAARAYVRVCVLGCVCMYVCARAHRTQVYADILIVAESSLSTFTAWVNRVALLLLSPVRGNYQPEGGSRLVPILPKSAVTFDELLKGMCSVEASELPDGG